MIRLAANGTLAVHGSQTATERASPPSQRRARLRLTLFLAAGVAAAGVMLGLYALDALKSVELRSVDTRFSVRGTQPQPKDLAVVAIDTKTFNNLKIQWPFPRRYHAKVLDRLRKDGAKAIAFDVQFTERDDAQATDNALIDAVGRTKNVVLATTEVDDKGHTAIFGGDQVAARRSAREAGNALLPNDSGGTIRRTWYDARKLKTLGIVDRRGRAGQADPALGARRQDRLDRLPRRARGRSRRRRTPTS